MASNAAGTVWDIVTSRSLAVWLLAIVTVVLGIGAVLPNPALLSLQEATALRFKYPIIYDLGKNYNSQEMARSWFFGSIGIFLILSTALCSIDRVLSRFRADSRRRALTPGTSEQSLTGILESGTVIDIRSYAVSWLRRGGWRVVVSGDEVQTGVTGIRGSAGFWGSVFFHAVLITALAGMVVYYFWGYRARLLFTEGQSYPLQEKYFMSVDKEPVWGFRLPEVELGLIRQFAFYATDNASVATDYIAKFALKERATGRQWEQDVRINEPMEISGKKFLLVVGGFTPRVSILRKDGPVVFDNYVALKKESGTEDSVTDTGEGLRIHMKLYPDYIQKDGRPGTRTIQLKNPFLQVTLRRGEVVVGEGVAPLGTQINAGDYRIMFQEVRRWVEMDMVGEPGIGFFFVLLFLGVAGIAVRMLDPEETFYIVLRYDGGRVHMAVTPFSRHFPGLVALKAEKFVRDLEANIGQGIRI